MSHIELEYRSGIPLAEYESKRLLLNLQAEVTSHTKRLAFMGFMHSLNGDVAAKVRITDGKCEVVSKKGDFHSAHRIETSQPIRSDQFIGFVRIFSQIFTDPVIAERETINFRTLSGIEIALVKSRTLAYIEFEMISNPDNENTNREIITGFMQEHNLPIMDKEQFADLCNRLDAKDDWTFHGTEAEFTRLEALLQSYI